MQFSEGAKLIVASENETETVIELGELVTIGRSSTNHVFVDDPDASRRHAEIRRRGQHYHISDLGSSNGTWLNGRRITVPKNLEDGDLIKIGNTSLRFVAAPVAIPLDGTVSQATRRFISNGRVVVLVADIRNYTAMSEVLPSRELSRLLSDWFRQASDIIERHSGTLDKFIGDAVMAYWVIPPKSNASHEVTLGLSTARDLMTCAGTFSSRMATEFPGYVFRIGVGMNTGDAMLGNVGTGENQSFTVVGDSVNVAFRLEALTKEKKTPVIVSKGVMEAAGSDYQFVDLGEATVKGRKEPISIWALNLEM